MKKLTTLTLAALTLAAGFAQAADLAGSVQVSTAYATLNNGYPSAKIQAMDVLFDVTKDTKVGVALSNIEAWGARATFVGLRGVHDINEDFFVTANIGASDTGKIAVERRAGAMLNMKTLPANNLLVGAGVDYYTMREGGSVTSVQSQLVYYVPGVPLVLQGNAALTRSNASGREGASAGIGATYGRVGAWTASARFDSGRVNYELLAFPAAIADYRSRTISASGRYWVAPSWGLSVNLSRVDNRYYARNEARVGGFWAF